MLLLALGDGGSGGDPENRASDLSSPLGKMLRIDVTKAADGRQYAIPPDNPFIAREGARPEILHYGLRNPFRDSFDPKTGDLWIGDVGQGAWEELDVARAGAKGLDFGWRRWEGRHCYNPSSGCDPTGVTQPVAEYSHDHGCAVIGGVVYHGTALPGLQGRYLFSDNCSGTLWSIDAADDDQQEPVMLLETGASISSVSTGDDGEVYLTDLGGKLVELVPAG
jgi:glucose/arabinose dehydrogenase